MTNGQIIALAIGLIAIVGAIGIFSLAFRRERTRTTVGTFDKEARVASRRRKTEMRAAPDTGTVATIVEEDEAITDDAPAEPELINVTKSEFDESRRRFLNRAIGASFGLYLAAFLGTTLAFLWPKLQGGFGSVIDAGDIEEIRKLTATPEGRIQPLYIAEAQSYVMPFEPSEAAGTAFDGIPVIAGGFTALWQKCVHLGCRVPWCASSQGFECPCHGSKYNAHGEYFAGPAPRNLDRFQVAEENGRLLINTGIVEQTPKASEPTIVYPQGPSC
ncbi:MAG: ubiquinol-cytochrome c reductase iron-sulfur subunit [Acidimicrobiia bacterium]|nr:ubiquinol-cytochrome c reductase iron-sulfur subunit [Acidimicrobiia bacterium]NNL27815.1 ubiquinol-cytochrome c reductase iron-sulfur subunit [Acidimicrobiia bacterium]NNL47622.1 ubiquinol-cytochrome c reductase iron-sulfur subunit [Acidimicrobiia bacterium]